MQPHYSFRPTETAWGMLHLRKRLNLANPSRFSARMPTPSKARQQTKDSNCKQLQTTATIAIGIGLSPISHRFYMIFILLTSRLRIFDFLKTWDLLTGRLLNWDVFRPSKKNIYHLPKWQEELITRKRTFATVHIKVFCRIERKRARSAPCATGVF